MFYVINKLIHHKFYCLTASSYGLFLSDEDAKKGVWLEAGRNLDYYILRNGDLIEYKKKLRTLKVRMLDGSLKTLLVDDSQTVSNLMVIICTKIGITNHDEYSLVRDSYNEEGESLKGNFGTLTLKKKKEDKADRDTKMDQLRKKLKTDDEGQKKLLFSFFFKEPLWYFENIFKPHFLMSKKESFQY